MTLRGPQAGSVRPVLRLGTKSGLTEASSGQQGSSSSLVEHFEAVGRTARKAMFERAERKMVRDSCAEMHDGEAVRPNPRDPLDFEQGGSRETQWNVVSGSFGRSDVRTPFPQGLCLTWTYGMIHLWFRCIT